MSADLMLTNKKKGMWFNGDKSQECVFITETSMGEPWDDFGKMISGVANGYGVFGLGREINDELIKKVKKWYKALDHHEGADIKKIVKWLEANKGEYLDYECW